MSYFNWWAYSDGDMFLVVKGVKAPLSESDWSKEDLKNPQKKKEMTTLLQTQEQLLGVLLDNAWENHWRQEQVGLAMNLSLCLS
jgi:hypothetical protein